MPQKWEMKFKSKNHIMDLSYQTGRFGLDPVGQVIRNQLDREVVE